MTAPEFKPSKEFILNFKKKLEHQRARAEEKNQVTQEIEVQPKPAPKAQKKQEPQIHAQKPSAIQQIALASIVARSVPQSTVATYQSGNYQITERKTYS